MKTVLGWVCENQKDGTRTTETDVYQLDYVNTRQTQKLELSFGEREFGIAGGVNEEDKKYLQEHSPPVVQVPPFFVQTNHRTIITASHARWGRTATEVD